MKKRTCSLVTIASVLLCTSVKAQTVSPPAQEEVAVLGLQSGRALGKTFFLPGLVAHNPRRLSTGVLFTFPDNTSKTTTDPLQRQLLSALTLLDKYDAEVISLPKNLRSEGIPHNDTLRQLGEQFQKDIIVVASLEAVGDNYWLLLRAHATVQGKILYSTKINYPAQPNAQDSENLATQIETFLSRPEISPAINTLTASPTELRLDTTPGNMHVYIGDRLMGLSPLIIKGPLTSSPDLKVFEQKPYRIDLIKIISTPPGVEVFINNEKQGVTPLEFPPEIRAVGTYDVRFAARGEFEAEIQIQTNPANIPVQLDESPIQRTPVSFQELSKKNYTLTLHPYRPISILYPIEEASSPLHLDAYKYAKLILNSSIKDASIELNNEPVGETPFAANVAQGKHELRISKNRYRTQERTLFLKPGETRELSFKLEPRSADTSIFFTPTGEITPQLNIASKFLGFGRVETLPVVLPYRNERAFLYGVEIDYGWPEIYQFNENFNLGLEISAAYFALQSESDFRQYPGLGTKVQFLRENDNIPISAAVGGYVTLDPEHFNTVGYLSLSRNFGDFALHLGLQTHGFNLNLGYTGWDNIRLGALVYADSFFKLLTENGERSTGTFYGLQAGYSF